MADAIASRRGKDRGRGGRGVIGRGCDESKGEMKQGKSVVQQHTHIYIQHLRKLDHLQRKQQSQWDGSY